MEGDGGKRNSINQYWEFFGNPQSEFQQEEKEETKKGHMAQKVWNSHRPVEEDKHREKGDLSKTSWKKNRVMGWVEGKPGGRKRIVNNLRGEAGRDEGRYEGHSGHRGQVEAPPIRRGVDRRKGTRRGNSRRPSVVSSGVVRVEDRAGQVVSLQLSSLLHRSFPSRTVSAF